MEYTISSTNVVALAVAVRFLGTFINKKVAFTVFFIQRRGTKA